MSKSKMKMTVKRYMTTQGKSKYQDFQFFFNYIVCQFHSKKKRSGAVKSLACNGFPYIEDIGAT